MRLFPFLNQDGGAGAPATPEPASVAPGAQDTPDAGNAPGSGSGEDVTKQESFAKRLKESTDKAVSEARKAWEGENAEKYKDYDTHKSISEYFQELNGMDGLTLKERVEMERLQERADRENTTPEMLQRLEELERKAAKGEELEAAQREQEQWQTFKAGLDEFAKDKTLGDKPLDSMELWQYMHENEIGKPEAAYRAMKADLLESQLATAKENAVKEYLESKRAPRVEGTPGAAAQSIPQTGGGFKGAEQRAAARIRAARSAE